MEQRVSLITLGVADLARAKAFYASLGWQGQEVQETVFFQAGGLAVVLWSRDALARDCGLEVEDAGRRPDGFGRHTLAHNVRSAAEVDALMAAAEQAGATVTAGGDHLLRRLRGCLPRPRRPCLGDRPQPGFHARPGRLAHPARLRL